MKNINKKEAVIISIAYIIFTALYSFSEIQPFVFIFFGIISLPVFFANKIFSQDKISIPNPLIVALSAAILNSSMYKIFFTEHIELNKFTAACAAAVFLAGFFAATDKKNFSYSILVAPILCFLNLRISACYSLLLAFMSIINIFSKHTDDNEYMKNKAKKDKKKTNTKINFNIIALLVSIVCLSVTVYLLLNPEGVVHKENFSYYINTFKGNPAVILTSACLLINLLKNSANTKLPIIISVVAMSAAAVAGYFLAGWTLFALACICILALLAYCSVNDAKVFKSLKELYQNHTFIFWFLLLCLLR